MPPKAVALTKDELYERCSSTIISARDVRAFVKDESFIQITTRNEQMIFFKEFLEDVCYISANIKLLATVYNIKEGNARKIMYKARQNKKY
ncbi:hypothetical protein M9Y10_016942 [Tritrichomonas musculus]|uniref:Uncharacterized protein n=1 Tax=Tritrichomonas musculus TaxID=1915356 RepID=A0ABR2HXM2_9EUKA